MFHRSPPDHRSLATCHSLLSHCRTVPKSCPPHHSISPLLRSSVALRPIRLPPLRLAILSTRRGCLRTVATGHCCVPDTCPCPLDLSDQCLSCRPWRKPWHFPGRSGTGFTSPRAALALLRRTLERWCEWIDALTHFQTHACWCLAPLQFDPDPEMRELAVLGTSQRLFGKLSAPSREWWQRHHNEAADRFKSSPKWRAVGKSMAA